MLGVQIDEKMKFDKHISDLCRKSGGQLNALNRLNAYLSMDSRKLSVNSFVMSNFNYCPLIWNFCNANLATKIEKIQERALRLINNDQSSYETLLENYGKCTIRVRTLRLLATEIFKTLNNKNPSYLKGIFEINQNRTSERFKYNIKSQLFKRVRYGKKSLRVLGPVLWNSLPNDIKSSNSLYQFKIKIHNWGNTNCPHYNKFKNYLTAIA